MIEFEITYTFRYKPDPEDYDGFTDSGDALDVDINNFQQKPAAYLPAKGVTVSGKVVQT